MTAESIQELLAIINQFFAALRAILEALGISVGKDENDD